MANFRQVFSEHGYGLLEPHSLERAIIDAIKNDEARYILGIPLILQKNEIDYAELTRIAEAEGVRDKLMGILGVASRIIKSGKKRKQLQKFAAGKMATGQYDENEFRRVYAQYSKAAGLSGFPAPLRYHLSFLFAKGQIEVLYKKKNGQRLTKTEKEYYSRVIKKKLVAIRELQAWAGQMLEGRG